MTVINTNIKALYTENAMKVTQRESMLASQQLSTGKRINSSADDPAGMAIASHMTQNIKSLTQAISNAGSGMSLIQTVDSAASSITTMLQRMSELAIQATNSTISSDQRGYLDLEYQQLKVEINRTAETQEWNGFPILNGKAGTPVGLPTASTLARPVAVVGSPPLGLVADDLTIRNSLGVAIKIPASVAADDTLSNTLANTSLKAASAIAIAAAINSATASTGVTATANAAEISGAKTTVGGTSIQTNLYLNGVSIPLSLSAGQTDTERRKYVMDTINTTTAAHGVCAQDSGNGGITLKTPDGRNLSVWYDASVGVTGADFGLGMNTASPSDPLGVTGCPLGSVMEATSETSALTFSALTAGQSVSVNGLTFTSTGDSSATQVAAAFANLSSGMTAASAKAANTVSAGLGTFSGTFSAGFTTGSNASSATVTATATTDNRGNVDSIIQASRVPTVVTTPGSGTVTENAALTFSSLSAGQSITVNGLKFSALNNMTEAQVATAYSSLTSGMTAAQATAANAASSAVGTYSGTFAVGFTTGAATSATVTATSTKANANVADIVVSSDTSFPSAVTTNGLNVAASTAYGTVSLNSETSFTIEPGTNSTNNSYSNFTTLGFVAGPVILQNVGRISFQVGAEISQTVTLDLGDFGKGGNITGVITSDTAKTAIDTTEGAQNVMNLVNTALNALAAQRSNMGSVINRLQEISDNLTTVQTNEMSSRSQIEDTDFAAASTQLSRTQIMTQAATAVLAQANTDMQTVLKLLQ